jgi:hypothetical protein
VRDRDVHRLLVPLAAVLTAGLGCGDALLPSDYAGPPAGAVAGNVIGASGFATKDVQNPGLSVEWLGDLGVDPADPAPLVDQAVMIRRSVKLDNDWDIGLARPSRGAGLDSVLAGRERPEVRFSVGKMVYFDDRVTDGRFDFSCNGGACDTVKAVSLEYVVFVEVPPTCQALTGARASVPAGYHYYRWAGGAIHELGPDEPMSFVLNAEPIAEALLSAQLRAFADALLASWSLAALGGC